MNDLSWIDSLSEDEAGAILKFKKQGIDSLSEEEAGLVLPHASKLKGNKQPSFTDKIVNSDLFTGTTGLAAGLADLAVGVPKMIVSGIAAPVRAAIHGDLPYQRQVAAEATENIFGTPSEGLIKLGIPERFVKNTLPQKILNAPFEGIGKALDYGTEGIEKATGSKSVAETARMLADVGLIAAPIPGLKAAKKASAKVLDKFIKPENIEEIRSGDVYSATKARQEDIQALREFENTRALDRETEAQIAEILQKEKEKLPEETTTHGAQLDLFRETPEEIIARQREQAKAEAEGILRDAQGEQGDLFLGQGKEPVESIIPKDSKPAEIDAAWAEREAEQKRLFDEDAQRFAVQQEPLTLEPSQGSSLLEKFSNDRTTNRPSPNELPPELQGVQELYSGFDVKRLVTDLNNIFDKVAPKTLDEFIIAAKQAGLETNQEIYKKIYENQTKQKQQQSISVRGVTPQVQQTLNNIPWFKKLNEAFLPVENVSKAIEELSGYKNDISYSPAIDKLTSGGVVQAALKNNRVVTVGVDLVNGLKKNSEIKTNEALLGRDGILTQRQHIEKTVGPKQFQSDFMEYVKSSLDPEYKPTYSQAGRSWVENLQKKKSEILSRWNDVRQQLGLKPVKELDNHFSLMREGPFGFTLKAPTGRVINGVAETELVAFVRERTKGSAQRAYEYYKNNLPEGWELSNVEYHTAYERAPFNKKARGEQLAMQDLASILGDDNVHVQKATDMYNKYLQQEARDTAGASAREKYRAGIEGAKGTKEWMTPAENVKEGMESIETYFRQVNDQIASLEAANQLQKIINDKSIEAPNAKALIQDYYDHAFNRVDRITDSMKGLTKWYEQTTGTDIGLTINGIRMTKNALMKMTLGFGNVGYLATQLIQPFQAMLPMFGYLKDMGAKGNASIAMVQGLGDAMSFFGEQYAGKQKVKFKDKLTASIWDYASKNHITAAHLLEKPTEYTNQTMSTLAKVGEKLSSREMMVFEGATRMMAFSGFTRFLVDAGMPLDLALKSADRVVEFTMGSYELHNKPRGYSHMGLVGELVSTLRTYQHNNLGQQAFYLKEAVKGNARGAIVQQLSNIAIFGGLLGLPFMADFDGIVDGYNKISGAKITTPTEFIITRFPQAISVGGLSALTGKDFHSRLGMPNVVPDSAVEGLFPLASKVTNTVSTGADFISNPTVENFGQFAKQPISSLQGTMEHFLLSDKTEDGKMLLRNKKTHTEAIRTPTESAIRVATGFKPLRETLESKENYLAKKDDQYRSEKLKSISEDIKQNIAEIMSAKQRGHEFRVNAAKQRNQKLAQRYMQLGGTEEGLDKLVNEFAIGRSATTPLQRREIQAAQQDSLMNIFKLNKLKELQQQND
jgi:hypothetical protein